MPTTYAIPNGATVFAATLYTGNGSSKTITNGVNNTTGVTFQPDMVWIGTRSSTNYDHIENSVIGATKYLNTNTSGSESTYAGAITSFNSNGFSVGDGTEVNANNQTLVGWQWKGGGAAVSNTAGSITSQVSASTTAGFSVVTYTGTGSVATVGHGLGATPDFLLFKCRNSSPSNWMVGGSNIVSAGNGTWSSIIEGLNTTSGVNTGGTATFNSTAPTSTVITLGTEGNVNGSGRTFALYCWAAIPGYSSFGKYQGNGSTDGPFIYTGFRPRWVMIKETTTNGAGTWVILDSSRDPYNQTTNALFANNNTAESASFYTDFLSNGFKLRVGSGSVMNYSSSSTYIYAAFAENPFKYANAR